jgi:PAS domain S-box-containing protein
MAEQVPTNTNKLRSRAEKHLKEKVRISRTALDSAPTADLIHELQVHQIELQMQTEELSRSNRTLENVLARYVEIFDFAPVSYLSLAKDGKIISANLPCTKMFGVGRSQLIGKHLATFVQGMFLQKFADLIARAFGENSRQFCDLEIVSLDSVNTFVRAEAIASSDKKACHVILIDLSERRKLEVTLNEAKLLAEKANTAKSNFLAYISHEIRGPLNRIVASANVLLQMFFCKNNQLQNNNNCSNILMNQAKRFCELSKIFRI